MDELDALRRFRAPLAAPDASARARVAERVLRSRGVPAARIRRRRRVALIAAITAGVLVTAAISGAAGGLLSVVGVTTDSSTTMPAGGSNGYIVGDELHDASGRLHQLSAAAAPSGLGDAVTAASGQVIYEAGNVNSPDLRLFDPATGSNTLVAAHAGGAAWRSDGALAYSRRETSPGLIGFKTTMVVRPSPTAPAVVWGDDPGISTALAWAGKTLIVDQALDPPADTLLAFTGPHESRVLARGAFISLSPDGTSVLVARGAAPDGIPSSPDLQLIDVASGEIRGTLDLRTVAPAGLEPGVILPEGPGDWVGDRIVFPAPAGLVVLSASGGHLALTKVAQFSGDPRLRGAEYHEARFANAAGDRVTAKAIVVPPKGGQMLPTALACDLVDDHCTRGATVDDTSEFLTLLFNPSRPAA